jgi:hypothetical protein
MGELLGFLAGEDSVPKGAISGLVLRAAGKLELGQRRQREAIHLESPEAELPGVPAVATVDPDLEEHVASANSILSAVTPEVQPKEAEYLEAKDDGQPDAALRFMAWLQKGLRDGTLPVNIAGALVHFVPEGMLLVSPRIFREFAIRWGAEGSALASAAGDPDHGKSIQRQVLRAGWHLRDEKGVNILGYKVMRGTRAVSQLSGVVIPNPERFIDPVPAVNPLLVRSPARTGSA